MTALSTTTATTATTTTAGTGLRRVLVAVVIAVLLWLMVDKTRIGAMIRAGVDNAEIARTSQRYADALVGAGRTGDVARLGRRLRPFILRRTKAQVLDDLPRGGIDKKKALRELIDQAVKIQEAKRYNLLPSESDINDRIKRLMPYFEQGKVWLPQVMMRTDYQGRTHDLVQAFIEEEYKAFPVGLHDDMLDSLARMFDLYPNGLEFPQEYSDEPEYVPSYSAMDTGAWMGA